MQYIAAFVLVYFIYKFLTSSKGNKSSIKGNGNTVTQYAMGKDDDFYLEKPTPKRNVAIIKGNRNISTQNDGSEIHIATDEGVYINGKKIK